MTFTFSHLLRVFVLAVPCLALAVWASGCSHGTPENSAEDLPQRFEIQGHRGARWVRPENTLSAFSYALEAGADTLEMDLNVTADDVLVVTHDSILDANTCLSPWNRRLLKPLPVRNLTLKELKRYDCGSITHPRFPEQVRVPGERIPTFEEVLSWLENDPNPRARTIRLNVETKIEKSHPSYSPRPDVFARLVIEALRKHDFLSRTTLQSFDFRTLKAARKLEPSIQISALLEDRPKEPLSEIALSLKAEIISPNHQWLTRADVDALHAAGIKVIPWTANTQSEWRKLVALGVDGIITDHPKALHEFRKSLSD